MYLSLKLLKGEIELNLIDRIIKATKDGTDRKVLEFDNYKIVRKLGRGEQAGVFEIHNVIGKPFALKLYDPEKEPPKSTRNKENLDIPSEIDILVSLSHRNIVNIFTGGVAIWDEKEEEWKFEKSYSKPSSDSLKPAFFYIMEFIEGEQVASIFSILKDNYDVESEEFKPTQEKLRMFEEFISQISKALIYSQSKKITHKDIKDENIKYSFADDNFIVIDFGFAQHLDHIKKKEDTVKLPDITDWPSIREGNYYLNDMGQFSRLLLKILPWFKSLYDENRYNGMESVLLKAHHNDLNKRYQNMVEFYNAIKQYFLVIPRWKLNLKINEYLTPSYFGKFNSKVRIPVSTPIILTKEVRHIIDTPGFQRLREVRQLGPAVFVFPGANHTRFEHSLGTYSLTLKYLNRLYDLPYFKEICEPLDDTIKLTVLTALLHDIGHYPYSHYIEQIEDFPGGFKLEKHEKRAKKYIYGDEYKIKNLLEKEWNVDLEVLCDLIAGKNFREKKHTLIHSFIDSPIDVDKLDYLRRDSVHCGVNYGMGIDINRILDSIYIDPSGPLITFTDKGRSCLLSILAGRNIMYQEVYWHKTVKACHGMFKRFLYEYLERVEEDITGYFDNSDERFINLLYQETTKGKHYDLLKLIKTFALKGRELYKPAFTIFEKEVPQKLINTRNLSKLIRESKSYRRIKELSEKLSEELKKIRGLDKLGDLDVLLEKNTVEGSDEVFGIKDLRIYNHRSGNFEDPQSNILDPLNNFLKQSSRVYIFCNPKFYDRLRKISPDEYERIFGKII